MSDFANLGPFMQLLQMLFQGQGGAQGQGVHGQAGQDPMGMLMQLLGGQGVGQGVGQGGGVPGLGLGLGQGGGVQLPIGIAQTPGSLGTAAAPGNSASPLTPANPALTPLRPPIAQTGPGIYAGPGFTQPPGY